MPFSPLRPRKIDAMSKSIPEENILFAWRVSVIETSAREIEGMAHLFDGLRVYDSALEKLALRQSAVRLREVADRLDKIERELKAPATAFPDFKAMQAAE